MAEIPEKEIHIIAEDNLHMHKGEEVILNKVATTAALRKLTVALGWDAPPEVEGNEVDIDACAFMLNHMGRVRQDTDFVFYNNPDSENCIRHEGDSTQGDESGDDEVIHVDLEGVPFDVERIAFSVTIHNAEERGQSFGCVHNAYIRIVNEDDGVEIAHFDLTEDAAEDDAMIFGELVREGMGWKFKAIGAGMTGGLYKIAREYGVNVAPL